MCRVSYLLAGIFFCMKISSLKATSDIDEPLGPPFAQASHLQMSTINPASFEFRTVRDPRQIAAASAHGVMDTKHIEGLFNSFPGFNREPPRTRLSMLMAFPSSNKSNKKKKPTVGQIITKIFQLRGVTKAEDYPKIFRFTKSRVSLDEFDRRKKMAHDISNLERGDGLDPKNVPRSSMLIIPGGVYDRTKPLLTNSGRALPQVNLFYGNQEQYDHSDTSF